MSGVHGLWLFVLSGLLLNITPGPDTLYVIGRSSTLGLRAGVLATLGIGAGVLVHICAAALGLSALLAASASAFAAVKWIGAGYLIYVGIGLIRAGAGRSAPAAAVHGRGVFLQGLLTNVLNPKVALFFLAFLPQFVDADATDKPWAFLVLGVIFDLNGTLWNLLIAWSSARLTRHLGPSEAFKKWFNRCVGSLLIGVGIRLAFARK